jgi:hypothetical protein
LGLTVADGIFFNHWGVTHELRLELFDRPTTWRAVVDPDTGYEVEVFFDSDTDVDIVDLIELAVEAWLADGE